MRQNGQRRPEEIQAEIERTRTDMDETLSAIERRLTPGELVDQGVHYLKNSGANDFVRNLGGQARHNPMPVALVGIGLAWLMASTRQGGRAYAAAGGSTSSTYEDMKSKAGERMEGMRSSLHSTTASLRDKASGAREALSRTSQSLTDTARSARERLWGAKDSAGRQLERARGGYDTMMREQPLALGAIGLAIGAILAAAAPRTRKEDELMGPARERLAEQAKEAGREQVEKAKQLAGAAQEAAKEEANRQPATPFPRGS